MDIIRVFFFNFQIFWQKLVKPTKTSENDHSFYNTISLKKSHSFYEPQLSWHWKLYAPATQSKTFLTLQTFQQRCFCLVSEKKFALHHFLAPKNYILEALWKQMSVYFSISPSENLCSKDIVRFYFMGGGLGGGRRLNNFLKAAHCLGLVKCFSIFHFNWNVWKFNFF